MGKPDWPDAIIERVGGSWARYHSKRWLWVLNYRGIRAQWTCDTKAEARAFAFTHLWVFVGAAAAGRTWEAAARYLEQTECLS